MILLVIDMQKALVCDELHNYDAFLKNVTKLINTARKNNTEIIYFKHDAGKDSGMSSGDEGFEIANEVIPQDNEKVYIKTINSCFGNNDFANYLSNLGEKELMIIGLQTEFCIDSTIKSAFERGYKVFVPTLAHSTFSNNYLSAKTVIKYYNEWIWPDAFAKCISLGEAIKLLKK